MTDKDPRGDLDEAIGLIAPLLGRLGRTKMSDKTGDILDIARQIAETTGKALNSLSEEEMVELVKAHLPQAVLAQANQEINKLNPQDRGRTRVGRTDLSKNIFFPNHQSFVDLIRATPLIKDIASYVQEKNSLVRINLHDSIFEREYQAKQKEESASIFERMTKWISTKKERPSDEKQSDIVLHPLGWPGSKVMIPYLKHTVFESSDVENKLALKLLDNIFSGNWSHGTALELGDRSIYDTGSFEIALADRIRYATLRWNSMCDEDKESWLAGNFTHSEDARKGRYDKVILASPNEYVG